MEVDSVDIGELPHLELTGREGLPCHRLEVTQIGMQYIFTINAGVASIIKSIERLSHIYMLHQLDLQYITVKTKTLRI